MKKVWMVCVAVLLCSPLLVQAQAYKCKQANGSVSFQDQPCSAGASGSAMALPSPASGAGKSSADARASKPKILDPQEISKREADAQREAIIQRYNAEAQAYNKMQRCNQARRQLGILKEPRRIFHYDDKGNKQYLEDQNRPAAIEEAERRVAEECK